VHLRIEIAGLLSSENGLTTAELAERLGKARSSIIRHLARLRRAGIVRYVGPKRGGHWEVHQPAGTRE
jgi:predicted transcriptional regulator